MPVTNIPGLIDERVGSIRLYHQVCGIPRAELDLSGGIDSAVMAGLLTLALGPDKITLVHSRINTNPEQSKRAVALAEGLGVPLIDIDLSGIFDQLTFEMGKSIALSASGIASAVYDRIQADPTILGSLRSCLRAPIGRGFNRLMGGGIRHGTGNECEDRFLRYYQKGGDGEVDTNPIEMLSKTEVYQVAWGLAQRFPAAKQAYIDTIKAKPSADLWGKGDEQTDEGELKKWLKVNFTYGSIDPKTGKITSFGTIERVSRFLDNAALPPGPWPSIGVDQWLFRDELDGTALAHLITRARESELFLGFSCSEIEALLLAARTAEKATRHKSNTNIPTLGTRTALVWAGLLTNDLTMEGEGEEA